ncbi:hypothetical protein QAD02_022911 [Eretmocerus hayati]|uniref:Uncharacterized protein n=1 Tax=Eretmocerus hayati TaxID=131215 RepID=A0ACC2PXQ1_9HYME|nr:hypothetical protein QAD02_022911 [Eretmocerus hayati]
MAAYPPSRRVLPGATAQLHSFALCRPSHIASRLRCARLTMGKNKRHRHRSESSSTDESSSEEELRKKIKRLKKKVKRSKDRRSKKAKHYRRRRDSSSSQSSSDSSSENSSNSDTQSSQHVNSSRERSPTPSPSPRKDRPPAPHAPTEKDDDDRQASANSLNAKENNDEIQLDQELINALGKRFYEERVLAPAMHSELVVRWKEVASQGLPDTDKLELIKKYSLPQNCTFSDPPKLNPEIRTALKQEIRSRDDRIVVKQQTIAASLASAAKALALLVKNGRDLQDLPVIESLSDTIVFLAEIQRNESIIRRSLILANIKSSLRDMLATTPIDEFLFGSNLDETIKAAKTLEAAAKDLQAPAKKYVPNHQKNSNFPPRQPAANRRSSGGNKNQNQNKKPQQQQSRSKESQSKERSRSTNRSSSNHNRRR